MNKDQRKKKARRQRKAEKRRMEEKARAAEKELPESLEAPDLEGEFEVVGEDQEEKDHFVEVHVAPPGPTSFQELDEKRQNEENMWEARRLIWDTEDISEGILHSSMDPDEKAKAFAAMGLEFAGRMRSLISMNKELSDLDADALHLEVLIAQDKEQTGILEKLSDIFGASKNTDGNFPLSKKADVRKSLGDARKMIEAGGEEADMAREVLPKILAAAKEMGVGQTTFDTPNALVVEKSLEGEWRWTGWVSNNFKDREHDFITDAAHKEYVEWLDEHPHLAPHFRAWHVPGTERKARADFWAYLNGFLVMGGPLTENEAKGLLRVQKSHALGMSHGFFPFRNPENKNEIVLYRSFEASDLPLEKAANPWTNIEAIQKEVTMSDKLPDDKAKYLEEQFGNEFVSELELATAKAQSDLRKVGIDEKETEDQPLDTNAEEEAGDDIDDSKEKQTSPDTNKAIATLAKAVGDEWALDKLEEWVKSTDTTIAGQAKEIEALKAMNSELSKDKDDELADLIAPRAATSQKAWEKRPSQKDDNIIDEDKASEEDKSLLETTPGEDGWLAGAMTGQGA